MADSQKKLLADRLLIHLHMRHNRLRITVAALAAQCVEAGRATIERLDRTPHVRLVEDGGLRLQRAFVCQYSLYDLFTGVRRS